MSNEYKDWRRDYWIDKLDNIINLDNNSMGQLHLIRDGSTPLNHNTIWNVDRWLASHQYELIGFGKTGDQFIYILFDMPLCETIYGPCTEEWLVKLRDSVYK